MSPAPKIAAVCGDDILPQSASLRERARLLPFSYGGDETRWPDDKVVMSANAYLGPQMVHFCVLCCLFPPPPFFPPACI